MSLTTAIRVSSGAFRSGLSEFLSRAGWGGDRIVVQRNGTPLAAVVPLEDLKVLESLQKRKDQATAKATVENLEHAGDEF